MRCHYHKLRFDRFVFPVVCHADIPEASTPQNNPDQQDDRRKQKSTPSWKWFLMLPYVVFFLKRHSASSNESYDPTQHSGQQKDYNA
mmetsp:Transcript_69447/g.131016  ORF Transcript_69447/g.131016 Transcript_69447/m.131016 type:complete len:87 (-) Transcript_69447:28-288(-)